MNYSYVYFVHKTFTPCTVVIETKNKEVRTMTQKLRDIKTQAFQLAQSLGLKLTQTHHFKKHVGQGLDLRSKKGWLLVCDRLRQLASGVVVHLLKQQPIAA